MSCERGAERAYADYVGEFRTERADLAGEIAAFRGMEDVLRWMRQRGLTRAAVDLIGMDEFSYDFLIQLEPGGAWLAFGVT